MANVASHHDLRTSSFLGCSTEQAPETIHIEREHTVFPAHPTDHRRIGLTSSDLTMLMYQYTQTGLLYDMQADSHTSAVNRLKKSFSQVLTHFYPLAGRLTTYSDGAIYIDCNEKGATFIEASAKDVTVTQVSASDVPLLVNNLFALNRVSNMEGHRLPLLAVQVTKLRDGIFIACSINHVVVDGVSQWHFLNSWAEICSGAQMISVEPVLDRLVSPARLNLNREKDIRRLSTIPDTDRVKVFHFSKDFILALKNEANRDPSVSISSLQSLRAHVWQAITRARNLDAQDPTGFVMPVDSRSRVVPPFPSSYFANEIQCVCVETTAGEVAGSHISVVAQWLHSRVHNYGDMSVRKQTEWFERSQMPLELRIAPLAVWRNLVILASSPRFKVYETDFGWGEPSTARNGPCNRYDGVVLVNPAKSRDGSMDMEISLCPSAMDALEIDQRFLNPFSMEDLP